jgi:hypothetical protein
MGVWYDSVRNRQREKTGAILPAGSTKESDEFRAVTARWIDSCLDS